jgi:hypothetical protein
MEKVIHFLLKAVLFIPTVLWVFVKLETGMLNEFIKFIWNYWLIKYEGGENKS